jgi:hypothetical protein
MNELCLCRSEARSSSLYVLSVCHYGRVSLTGVVEVYSGATLFISRWSYRLKLIVDFRNLSKQIRS